VRIGDLIEWAGKRWVIIRMERPTRSAIVADNESNHDAIPDNLDKIEPGECRVIANIEDWPYCSVAARPRFRRLISVVRPDAQGDGSVALVSFKDWLVSDPGQAGGAIFFNPNLGLRHGDRLVANYQAGTARLQIPREFLSTSQKRARAEAEVQNQIEPQRRSLYERLRTNEFADPDDKDP
jgi:hypothetical protein